MMLGHMTLEIDKEVYFYSTVCYINDVSMQCRCSASSVYIFHKLQPLPQNTRKTKCINTVSLFLLLSPLCPAPFPSVTLVP